MKDGGWMPNFWTFTTNLGQEKLRGAGDEFKLDSSRRLNGSLIELALLTYAFLFQIAVQSSEFLSTAKDIV